MNPFIYSSITFFLSKSCFGSGQTNKVHINNLIPPPLLLNYLFLSKSCFGIEPPILLNELFENLTSIFFKAVSGLRVVLWAETAAAVPASPAWPAGPAGQMLQVCLVWLWASASCSPAVLSHKLPGTAGRYCSSWPTPAFFQVSLGSAIMCFSTRWASKIS